MAKKEPAATPPAPLKDPAPVREPADAPSPPAPPAAVPTPAPAPADPPVYRETRAPRYRPKPGTRHHLEMDEDGTVVLTPEQASHWRDLFDPV